MLGGNPEHMAKSEMARLGIRPELIAEATGSAPTENQDIKNARNTFKIYFEKYKAQIEPDKEKVIEAGGLCIIGSERHESRRIDNQLRGRAGRQGDPGESRFYISLEDDLMRLFGSERILGMVDRLGLPEDTPIDAKILSNTIEGAQKRIEDQNFKRRKYVLTYDDVMNQQRNIIYGQRNSVLNGEDIGETIRKMISATINDNVAAHLRGEEQTAWDFAGLRELYRGLLTSDEDFVEYENGSVKAKPQKIAELLEERAFALYEKKIEEVGEERFKEIERAVLLQNVDRNWMDHIDAMDDLKDTIRLQAYAQRDPVTEYRIQGADMFDAMVMDIRDTTVRMILSVTVKTPEVKRVQLANPLNEGFEGQDGEKKPKKVTVVKKGADVGRNDLCPCGSGKKYKKCCGAPGANGN